MATEKKSPAPPKRTQKPDLDAESKAFLDSHPFTFVSLPIGPDEKDEIAANQITAERMFEFVKEVVVHQYKLSVNWDNKHSCYVVSLTGNKFFRDDYNRCVTSRHYELWIAMAISEYKFFRFISGSGIEPPAERSKEIFD